MLVHLPKKDFAANFVNFSLFLFDFTAKLNINGFGVKLLAWGWRREAEIEKGEWGMGKRSLMKYGYCK